MPKNEHLAEDIQKKFVSNLLIYPEAISYLNSRGIKDNQLIDSELGFCPPYFNARWALLKGRITVPIRDEHSKIVAFAGRIFEPMREVTEIALKEYFFKSLEEAQEKIEIWENAKWLNEPFSKQRYLYHLHIAKQYARKLGYVVVVEGYMDALVLDALGIKNVVAVCSSSITELQIAKIARYCRRVVLMLDGDSAGVKGAQKMIGQFKSRGFDVHAIYLPNKYDPDDFGLEIGGDKCRAGIEKVIKLNLETVNAKIEKV